MHPREIRRSFLRYFEKHGHRVVASSPLLPGDDPTLLFTNAGMNQFKDVFLGREKRDYRRAATSQKCMRVSGKHNDLDNVGPSLRHHTFFEMLGNFSFGDYFKHDAIELAWNLLTREWGLDPSKLYVTVFKGENGIPRDDEGYKRWLDFVPADHIGELGMADNFWAMGETGPCGRCSEIYVDRGASVPGTGNFIKDVEGGSERFVEIWNNVFMEFERDDKGTLTPLPAPSIDTGMGLERISAVMQGTMSNYDTPLFMPILEAISDLCGQPYARSMSASDISMRVVADHIRASTFLIADGVMPSNEHRGYVLRKIMRRAMRHGRKLEIGSAFLYSLVDVVVREMGDAYPELKAHATTIKIIVESEEDRFSDVLTFGMPWVEHELELARNTGVFDGKTAFRLYETHGVPRDFMEDLVANHGLRFDTAGFDDAIEAQRQKARSSSNFKASDLVHLHTGSLTSAIEKLGPTAFVGYNQLSVDATITALSKLQILQEAKSFFEVSELKEGEEGYAALSETPFYLQAGGQVSDKGLLSNDDVIAFVENVEQFVPGWARLHKISVLRGVLRVGTIVNAAVDQDLRDATRRNHTATHLLHAALRNVLGAHVKQAGSLVAPDRLRFDFSHFAALTPDELQRVERIVNESILLSESVHTEISDTQAAISSGAMALFGEKYGDKVRVVSIGDGQFSKELCGGTHVRETGQIGSFFVTSESGVAGGVRRIEAVTGLVAFELGRVSINAARAVELSERPNEQNPALRALLKAADPTRDAWTLNQPLRSLVDSIKQTQDAVKGSSQAAMSTLVALVQSNQDQVAATRKELLSQSQAALEGLKRAFTDRAESTVRTSIALHNEAIWKALLPFATPQADFAKNALETVAKFESLQTENKKLLKEIQQLKGKIALGSGSVSATGTVDDPIEIGQSKLIVRQVNDVDSESLRTLADTLKSRLKSGIVVLAAAMPEGKVSLIVTVTPDLAKKAPAGQLVKTLAPIVGGGGGGRPDFAQAGGKDASKITDLLATAKTEIQKLLQ